jgi:sterol desaturase/sphingolipid hydroxylase (fatty acid hydroxylase superfamily)
MEFDMKYIIQPTLLAIVLGVVTTAIAQGWNYGSVYGGITGFLVITLIIYERCKPLKTEWSMTRSSFWRDVKYLAVDAPTIVAAKSLFGMAGIWLAGRYSGPLRNVNVFEGTILYLLTFEFLQYWFHRLSHRGGALWRIHVAHHLPDKVYVVMHGVFNPINILITTMIIQGLIISLGVSPEVALVATILIDLQSLISHCNADIRGGWLNYVLVGPELHRYHHSADTLEAKNYGNTLVIWDILFGTFYYRPHELPKRLGVDEPKHYPDSRDIAHVLTLPFRKAAHTNT